MFTTTRRRLLASIGLVLGGCTSLVKTAESQEAPLLTKADMIGKNLRVLQPNTIVNMMYSPDRVNILLDEQGRIADVTIG